MKRSVIIGGIVFLIAAAGLMIYTSQYHSERQPETLQIPQQQLYHSDRTTTNEQETTEEEREMIRGKIDPSYTVSQYDPERAYNGTTLFADSRTKRIVEMNMLGEIVWEFTPPKEWLKKENVIGMDVERLENGNILMCISESGIYEITPSGELVWSYIDPKNSHDVDRLPNGNTLFVFGARDEYGDVHVKEIDPDGNIVWQWSASDIYDYAETSEYEMQGWTHINAAQRLENGNTMINLRNFFRTIIVNPAGEIVREYDWTAYGSDTDPHDPEIDETSDTMIVCLQNDSPYEAVEIDLRTEELLWSYNHPSFRTTRDCDRLPNGNTLIVGVYNSGTINPINTEDDFSTILEVTSDGEIVWQMQITDETAGNAAGWIYNAERY